MTQEQIEIIADMAADKALIKAGKPGKEVKYTISQIVAKYPEGTLNGRTISYWCNKKAIGTRGKGRKKWYVTVSEIEGFFFGSKR